MQVEIAQKIRYFAGKELRYRPRKLNRHVESGILPLSRREVRASSEFVAAHCNSIKPRSTVAGAVGSKFASEAWLARLELRQALRIATHALATALAAHGLLLASENSPAAELSYKKSRSGTDHAADSLSVGDEYLPRAAATEP
jgi:hypothetical protein